MILQRCDFRRPTNRPGQVSAMTFHFKDAVERSFCAPFDLIDAVNPSNRKYLYYETADTVKSMKEVKLR